MRNIFLLLSCLFCLQACNEEQETDWTPDALTVSCNETLEEAGDGHWKVALPTEYKGSVTLEIKTDKAWGVEVSYMTTEKEEWITPSAQSGEGSASLSLAIADNATVKDRRASVVITTKGEIPVKKIITIIQGNVDELLVVGTIDKSEFPAEVFISEKADGSFSVTLPKDFTEEGEQELKLLTYEGTVAPVVDIDFPDEDNQNWIEVKEEDVATRADKAGSKVLALVIKQNETNVYREAMINFTATAGDITVKKAVQIIQFGIEEVIWNPEYFQQEAEFIISSDANDKILIATCKNINPADIELSGENDWLTLTREEEKVYAEVTANGSTNKERTAKIGVKNAKTSTVANVAIRQGMKGYGIVLNKSTWDIPAYSDNVGKKKNEFKKLYDNDWADKNHNPYVQFDKKPYEFTFDLGENPHKYDCFGIMPRLQWTAPAPKTLQLEISNDMVNWTIVVAQVAENGFKSKELEYECEFNATKSNKYENHYEGIVKWFKLSEEQIQYRYIRLTVYDTFWDSGNVLCFDEIFVSDRSNVVE